MDEQHFDYLRRLEDKLKILLSDDIPLDEGYLKEYNRNARERSETAEKLVLWHAVHGSTMFDTDKI